MTVEQWNGMTQREKDEACAKAEGWTYRNAASRGTNMRWHTHDGRRNQSAPPDFTNPEHYERLKRKAIEADSLAFFDNLLVAVRINKSSEIDGPDGKFMRSIDAFWAARATPDQVCLASVLTLGRS